MQLDPPTALNGFPLRTSLFFFPSTFFLLANVILLSLAFVGVYLCGWALHSDPSIVLALLGLVFGYLYPLLYWFLFNPPRLKYEMAHKTQKTQNSQTYHQLKRFMLVSAYLPLMGPLPESYSFSYISFSTNIFFSFRGSFLYTSATSLFFTCSCLNLVSRGR